jgi:hypothetical protein
VGREQRRWATAERKKESGEVGRLGQNKLEKEEWPRVDIKNRNPFIFSNFFKKIIKYFEFKSNLKFELF